MDHKIKLKREVFGNFSFCMDSTTHIKIQLYKNILFIIPIILLNHVSHMLYPYLEVFLNDVD